jgi:hypothetical protein
MLETAMDMTPQANVCKSVPLQKTNGMTLSIYRL